MAKVRWIKLTVDMFEDDKIKMIKNMPEGYKIIVVWVQLLCLAGKKNDSGLVYMDKNIPFTDEMLATTFNEPINIIRIAIQTLEQLRMIEVKEEGVIDIVNWSKHQNIEGLDRIKQQDAQRQKVYYYRNKLKELGVDVTNPKVPGTADRIKEYYNNIEKNLTLGSRETHGTEREEELEIELEEELEEEKEGEEDQEKTPTAAAESDIKKVNIFFENNFGKINHQIKQNLQEWIDEIGIELVLEAMKRSAEAQKHYKYAKAIMEDWKKNNIKSIEEVEVQDRKYASRKKQSYSQIRKPKKETLPDWAKENYQVPTEEVEIKDGKKNQHLSRLQELRREKGIEQ